jgi:hypothetical protein
MSAFHHSFVGFPAQYQRYVGLGGTEQLCDSGLCHRASEISDFGNFFRCQQLLVEGDESGIDCMLFVQAVGSPFEIGRDAICLDAVDMVDDGEFVRIWDKGHCHETVEQECLPLTFSEKRDLKVRMSAPTAAGSQNFTVACLQPKSSHAEAIDAADSTKVADFVKVAEMFDRNRSPFFNADDIHVTGCLSGYGGLAIKDPSHAPTFGGSAIMASGSITYNRSAPCQ